MARDHYIPQVYLKQFHCKEGDSVLYMIKKDANVGLANLVNTRDICQLKDGNRSSYFADEDALEKWLKFLEPQLPNVFKNILSKNIDNDTIIKLAYLISYITCCTPQGRQQVEIVAQSIIKGIIKTDYVKEAMQPFPNQKNSMDKILQSIDVEIDPEYSLAQSIGRIPEIARILYDGKWDFFYSKNNRDSFITSDNPVVIKRDVKNFKTCFIISISPAIIVSVSFNGYCDDENILKKIKMHDISKVNVRRFNRSVIKYASNMIFYSDNNREAMIKLIKTNSHYKQGVSVNNFKEMILFENKLINNV